MRKYSTTTPAFQLNPRIIILAVAGLALLTILVFGIRALYCATASETAEIQQETVTPKAVETPAAPKTEPAPKANAAPRTQQNIPSLYID